MRCMALNNGWMVVVFVSRYALSRCDVQLRAVESPSGPEEDCEWEERALRVIS